MLNRIIIICLFALYFANGQKVVRDIHGNKYNLVEIGNQVWTAENLKVTRYKDGSPILLITDESEWDNINIGAIFQNTNNSQNYTTTYGNLYNYYAIADDRGICPEGFRVPTKIDWDILINYLGGYYHAGDTMKDIDSGLWTESEHTNRNTSGFSALPAGGKGRLGPIGEIGLFATWWSITEYDSNYSWHFGLYPKKASIRFNPGHNNSGFSVRCIQCND